MVLFHFSEDPAIGRFEPRPVVQPSDRGPGRDWLNGPLVWAIEPQRQAMYLFPRDCPRIVLWLTPATTPADRERWFGASSADAIAYIEWAWLERVRHCRLHRYVFDGEGFENLHDAGMWISRRSQTPTAMDTLDDLFAAQRAAGVELRVVERLSPVRPALESSLHFSGVRLRNARDWS